MMSTLDFIFTHEKKLWMLIFRKSLLQIFFNRKSVQSLLCFEEDLFLGKNGWFFFFYSSHYPLFSLVSCKISTDICFGLRDTVDDLPSLGHPSQAVIKRCWYTVSYWSVISPSVMLKNGSIGWISEEKLWKHAHMMEQIEEF